MVYFSYTFIYMLLNREEDNHYNTCFGKEGSVEEEFSPQFTLLK